MKKMMSLPSSACSETDFSRASAVRIRTQGGQARRRRTSREWNAIAFSTLPEPDNGRLRSPYSAVGHNATCWRVYIAARGGRNGPGTACNLVIDQFVTIWRFVCIGPVNAVYPGCWWSTSKRGLFVRPTRTGPVTATLFLLVFLFFFYSILYYEFLSKTHACRDRNISPSESAYNFKCVVVRIVETLLVCNS